MAIKSQGARTTRLADLAAALYSDRLHRFLLRRMGPNAAEDLVQEVYVRLLQVSVDALIADPQSYIFTVARHVLGDFARREQKQRAAVCVDSAQLEQAAEAFERIELDEPARWVSSSELLQQYFNGLRPELQAALMLHVDGCSFAEIATKLEVSERAARRYVDDARQGLRRALALDVSQDAQRERRGRRHA